MLLGVSVAFLVHEVPFGYPLANAVTGSLIAVQFVRARFAWTMISGALGATTFVWLTIFFLPMPGIRIAFQVPVFLVVLISVVAAIVGLIVGLIYQSCVRLILGREILAGSPRSPFRFSLRRLTLFVSVLAVIFAGIAQRVRQFGEERKLADSWAESGVSLTFDYWSRPKAAWVLPNSIFDDSSLAKLTALRELRSLGLGGSKVTDAGMAHLTRLSNLQHLNIGGLPITDAGVAQLTSVQSLEYVDLFGTHVSPSGVASLTAINGLENVRVHRMLKRGAATIIRRSGSTLTLTEEPAPFRY